MHTHTHTHENTCTHTCTNMWTHVCSDGKRAQHRRADTQTRTHTDKELEGTRNARPTAHDRRTHQKNRQSTNNTLFYFSNKQRSARQTTKRTQTRMAPQRRAQHSANLQRKACAALRQHTTKSVQWSKTHMHRNRTAHGGIQPASNTHPARTRHTSSMQHKQRPY